MSGTRNRRVWLRMAANSLDSPLHDMANTMSSVVTMPRSPWLASLGCTNIAGVPVEASVDASLRPMWPLLPIPVMITRPRIARITPTALTKASPNGPAMAAESAANPSLSTDSVRQAVARGSDVLANGSSPEFVTVQSHPVLRLMGLS